MLYNSLRGDILSKNYQISRNSKAEEFINIFRHYIFEVVEYSYSSQPHFLGTMLYGTKGKFLERAVDFGQRLGGRSTWARIVHNIVDISEPIFVSFKINWMNEEPLNITIYFRYMGGVSLYTITDQMPKEIRENIRSLVSIINLPATERDFILGIREDKDNNYSISVYYNINSLNENELTDLYSKIVKTLSIHNSCYTWLTKAFLYLNELSRPELLGVDLSSSTLKFDYRDILVRDFLNFLKHVGAGYVRTESLRKVARSLGRSKLNYMSIKADKSGQNDWKAYFTVSQHNPKMKGFSPQIQPP